jgi:hypothetical protein
MLNTTQLKTLKRKTVSAINQKTTKLFIIQMQCFGERKEALLIIKWGLSA